MQISLHSVSLPRDTAWDLCSGSFGGKKEERKKNRREPPFVWRHWIGLLSLNPAWRPLRAPLCSHKKPPTFMKPGENASERRTALMEGWGNEKDKWCVCAFREERAEKYRKALKWTHAQWSLGMMLLATGAWSRMLCRKETFTMRSLYCHGLLGFPYFACFFMFNMKAFPCISPVMDVYIESFSFHAKWISALCTMSRLVLY